ncbi:hypothetical protein CCP3SC15_2150003 [Gammaproteobacteria bacterium]
MKPKINMIETTVYPAGVVKTGGTNDGKRHCQATMKRGAEYVRLSDGDTKWNWVCRTYYRVTPASMVRVFLAQMSLLARKADGQQ